MFFVPVFALGIVLFSSFPYFPYLTCALAVSLSLYLLGRRRPLLVLALCLALAYAAVRAESDLVVPAGREPVAIRCVFSTYPLMNSNGSFRQTARIISAVNRATGDPTDSLRGREVAIISERGFSLGSEYDLEVSFLKDPQRYNPGALRSDSPYARLLNVEGQGTRRFSLGAAFEGLRYRLDSLYRETFSPDSAGLLAAMTIGQRAHLSEQVRHAFNASGLAHLLSISGTHFGLFSLFLFAIFRVVICVLPYGALQRLTVYLTPSQAAAILSVPFMVAYLGISGGSIPAIRSFIMISFFLVGLMIERKGFWLQSLGVAVFLIVLWDPMSLFTLSFQLSFLAVLFIGYAVEWSENVDKRDPAVLRHLRKTGVTILAATIGTAPLVAYSFHYISLISPLSNLLVAPFIGFVLIPLSLLSAFVFLLTNHYPFPSLISRITETALSMVDSLSDISFADIGIPAFPPVVLLLFYGAFFLFFLDSRRKYLLVLPLVTLVCYGIFSLAAKNVLSVTFLDVGQGDAAVVELPDGKTLVVDTGLTGREVASFLRYRGKGHIDALALSHGHPDHIGGLPFLAERFHVKEIWHAGQTCPEPMTRAERCRFLSRGDLIDGEGYRIAVLHPYPEFYTQQGGEYVGDNNRSLVLRISDDRGSFLFAGDAEREAQDDILHLEKWIASDVVKVPHHGGKTSAHSAFFDAVNPEIAVICAGRENPFGHPHEDMLALLRGRIVLRTDTDGAIKVWRETDSYRVKTYRDFQIRRAGCIADEIENVRRLFRLW